MDNKLNKQPRINNKNTKIVKKCDGLFQCFSGTRMCHSFPEW